MSTKEELDKESRLSGRLKRLLHINVSKHEARQMAIMALYQDSLMEFDARHTEPPEQSSEKMLS